MTASLRGIGGRLEKLSLVSIPSLLLMSLLLSNPILYLAKQFHKHSLEDGHWTLNGQIKIVRAVLLRSWSVWRERQVTSKVSKGWPCWWTMSMKEEVCVILCSYIKWIMAEFFSPSLSNSVLNVIWGANRKNKQSDKCGAGMAAVLSIEKGSQGSNNNVLWTS